MRYEFPHVGQFSVGQIKQATNVPLWNDECVTFCDWKAIVKSYCEIVLQQNAAFINIAKRALVFSHSKIIATLNPGVQVDGDRTEVEADSFTFHVQVGTFSLPFVADLAEDG